MGQKTNIVMLEMILWFKSLKISFLTPGFSILKQTNGQSDLKHELYTDCDMFDSIAEQFWKTYHFDQQYVVKNSYF